MANRSYLFAVDHVPERSEDRPGRIAGLSEWPYDIPLAYQLLVSDNTRICASLGFSGTEDADEAGQPQHVYAIAGDWAGGLTRLLRFLDLLAHSDAGRAHETFSTTVAETKAFLTRHAAPFAFLETAEIDCMSEADFRVAIERNVASVRRYAELVDSLDAGNIAGHLAPGGELAGVLDELGKHDSRELPTLGIGYWTNVLWLAPQTRGDMSPQS
jgi:hypothetical protein